MYIKLFISINIDFQKYTKLHRKKWIVSATKYQKLNIIINNIQSGQQINKAQQNPVHSTPFQQRSPFPTGTSPSPAQLPTAPARPPHPLPNSHSPYPTPPAPTQLPQPLPNSHSPYPTPTAPTQLPQPLPNSHTPYPAPTGPTRPPQPIPNSPQPLPRPPRVSFMVRKHQ